MVIQGSHNLTLWEFPSQTEDFYLLFLFYFYSHFPPIFCWLCSKYLKYWASRSNATFWGAGLAQMVERSLIVWEVPGSILDSPALPWLLTSCGSDSWDTTCNRCIANGSQVFWMRPEQINRGSPLLLYWTFCCTWQAKYQYQPLHASTDGRTLPNVLESFRMEKHSKKHSEKHSETHENRRYSAKIWRKDNRKHTTVLEKTHYCVKNTAEHCKTHGHAETLYYLPCFMIDNYKIQNVG